MANQTEKIDKEVYCRYRLIRLLTGSLWNQFPDAAVLDGCDWEELMALAKNQTVTGLVWEGIDCLPDELKPERKMKLRWIGEVVKVQDRSRKLDDAVVAICEKYSMMGIRPLVMKGQVIAREYENPLNRQGGDIDLCFRTGAEARKAYQWAEGSEECKCKSLVNEKEQPFEWRGIEIENHERLSDLAYKPYQDALQKIIKRELAGEKRFFVEINGVDVETLPPLLTVFHQILHIGYHVLNEGIGLRQFCDLAVFTVNHSEELMSGRDRLGEWLQSCGLEKMAAAIGWILHAELGVGRNVIPWHIAPEGAGIIMEDVWRGGNFGKEKWAFKGRNGFLLQKVKAMPLHWMQYRKYRKLLPHEAWANFISKFFRAARGVK